MRFVGVLAAGAMAAAVACGAVADPNLPAPTPTLRPYTPPFEEEFSESLLIADITIEELRAMLGEPKTEEAFIERLPVLSVTPWTVFAILDAGAEVTEVLDVSLEGPGPFEWDYLPPDEMRWLEISRPLEEEEGDFDTDPPLRLFRPLSGPL
jgi:hypothetical protein